jgi:tRNA U38,U39,U40 pseudouridine synthase TruA
MLAFGFGKITLEELMQILRSPNRRSVVNNVPPQGLFLKSVEYPENSLVLLANHQQTIIHDHVASR